MEGVRKLREVSPTYLVRGGAPVKVSAEVQHPPAPSPPNAGSERRVSSQKGEVGHNGTWGQSMGEDGKKWREIRKVIQQ